MSEQTIGLQFAGMWATDHEYGIGLYQVGDVVIHDSRCWVAVEPALWWNVPGTEAGAHTWMELVAGV